MRIRVFTIAALMLGATVGWLLFGRRETMPESARDRQALRGDANTAGAGGEHTGTYSAPIVNNIRLAKLVDKRAPLAERIPDDISSRILRVDDAKDAATLCAILQDPTEDDAVRNEIANLLRRSEYAGLSEVLMKVIEDPAEKPRFRAFAVQHLGGMGLPNDADLRNRVAAKLRSLLADRHTEVRREALLALCRKGDPLGAATAVAWLRDSGRGGREVRDLAIRCAHELNLREQSRAIRECLNDPGEAVRIASIVTLSDWKDAEAYEAIRAAAEAKNVRISNAAKMGLSKFTTR